MGGYLAALAVFAVRFLFGPPALGDEQANAASPQERHGEWVPVPTMGGTQFWADELFMSGWRIQQNVLTGHYRLLDPDNRRHAWGTFRGCRDQLAAIRRQRDLPPMRGTAVIVLHGLVRSRGSMDKLCGRLREEGGMLVVNVTYPSTRRSIAEHARSLARLVENLEGIERIHFVGHSMGNIVIRRYLHDQIDPATGKPRDKRFGRMVMLGPPNQGSQLAEAFSENELFRAVSTAPGQELGADWEKLQAELATPPFAFGIIAGGRGDQDGFNPLLPGDDDGVVSVASTRLAGAADFTLVPVLHSFLMNHPIVIERTVRFLKHGYFLSPSKRRPV